MVDVQHNALATTQLHDAFHYAQSSNPGAVGAGKYWLDTTSEPFVLYRRNAGDTDWARVGQESVMVDLHLPFQTASAAATNLAAATFSAVSDPNYRRMVNLLRLGKVRIQGRIGGTLVAASKLRIQYHTGGDPAVATGDGGWTTLADTAGSHTVNVMFYSAEIAVPSGAQVNNVLIRVGLYDGDGAADPTITTCVLNLYP